jgi:hypothetical protein
MKNAIIVLSALLLVVTIGCGKKEEGPSPEIKKMFAEMKLENAPTLGPVYEKYMTTLVNKEWGANWDVMSSGMRMGTEEALKQIKLEGDTGGVKYFEVMKAGQEAMMNMPNMTETQKANCEAMIKKYDKCIADIDKIKAMSAKEYYIYDMSNQPEYKAETTGAAAPGDAEKHKMVCEKEEFSGDTGNIVFKTSDNREIKTPFAKEDGVWKYGMAAADMPGMQD